MSDSIGAVAGSAVGDGQAQDIVAGGPGGDLSGRKKRRSDNKTVTFGDASAVRSLPAWSIASLVVLLLFWYLVTKAWGYPADFAAGLDADATADRDLFRECQLSPECDVDSYTQIVRPITFPSPKDTANGFVELFTDGFRNISLWQHTWASL